MDRQQQSTSSISSVLSRYSASAINNNNISKSNKLNKKSNRLSDVDAVRIIQKIYRRYYYKRKGHILLCELLFLHGFNNHDGKMLQRAILKSNDYNLQTRVIKSYKEDARKLISNMMSESYVADQLTDAIKSGSINLLKSAISLAVSSNMPLHNLISEAKDTLSYEIQLKTILINIESILELCTSIPVLVSSVDKLREYVKLAMNMGLKQEKVVYEAILRMNKIRNLIDVRDRLRHAVEVCSIKSMDKALAERNKLVLIYGNDFLLDEVKAIEGIKKMYLYESQLGVTTVNVCDNNDKISTMDNQIANDSSGADDIDLPIFVKNQLETLKNSKTPEEFTYASNMLNTLIPQEASRRKYMRLFKWVVAYAFWKYDRNYFSQDDAKIKNAFDNDDNAVTTSNLFTSMNSSTIFATPNKNASKSMKGTSNTTGTAITAINSTSKLSATQLQTEKLVTSALKKGKALSKEEAILSNRSKHERAIADTISKIHTSLKFNTTST